jgi:hypothetical protein
MKARADELLRAVLSLPIEERAAIAARLLASLEEAPDDPALAWFDPAVVEADAVANASSRREGDDEPGRR